MSLSFGYDQIPEQAFSLAGGVGIGWVRAVLNWNLVEPAPGQYTWTRFDRLVGYARANRLRMVGGLGYATSWNTTAPPSETREGRRLMYPPADLKAWKRYVTNLVTRYKDVVRAWEVWNEPDLEAFWVGTPAQYAQLLAITYETVKRADPTATVVLGGLALGGSPGRLNRTFLEEILADPVYPAAQYFDVAAFHHYGPQREAQRRMEYVRSALARAGAASKEIWITEAGYTSNPAEQELPQYQGGPEAQARWLKDTLPYLFQLGAARVFWFQLIDNPHQAPRASAMGLLNSNAEPKVAYYTYRELIAEADRQSDRHSAASGTSTATVQKNPFGVMLPSQLVRSSKGMQIAKALGAVYFRPASIFLDQWNGTCPECDIALKAGLKLVLTVRNSGPLPTAPPSDLAAYKRELGQVLDKYRPVVLAVENEENSALFYTGTPEDYAAQLKAACQVAHQKGISCTNGGLVSVLVALLVYDHYRQSGQPARAQDFAARAFAPGVQRQLHLPQAQEQIRKGKALLKAYRAAGVDYVNFHWYVADPQALGEAVAYLRAQTGLPVITNEIGQFTDDPHQTTAVMGKIVELGLPIAVWFGLDGPKARRLVNIDGSLRPTGQAFQRFIEEYLHSQ